MTQGLWPGSSLFYFSNLIQERLSTWNSAIAVFRILLATHHKQEQPLRRAFHWRIRRSAIWRVGCETLSDVRDARCASYGIYYKYIHSLHLLQLFICNRTAVCNVAKLAKPVSKYREFVVHNPYRYHLGNV